MSAPILSACPAPGSWRAWLDSEESITAAEEHLRGCLACSSTLTQLRRDAAAVRSSLDLLVESPPPALGRQVPTAGRDARTEASATPPQADIVVLARRRARRAAVVRSLTAAAAVTMVAVLVGTPSGRSFASAVLSQFRSERVTLVEVQSTDAQAAVELMAQLGEVDAAPTQPQLRPVADIAEAEALAGFDVARVDAADLPEGISVDPTVSVALGNDVTFTFDAQRTRDYLSGMNDAPALPVGYDGARLSLHIPDAVLLDYPGTDGLPSLLVGTAEPVRADVIGDVSLKDLRTFLLDLPGMPASLAQQLRSIDDWSATLAVPVPVDLVRAERTSVGGFNALTVEQPGLGAGVVWQQDQAIIGVAGRVSAAELTSLAERVSSDMSARTAASGAA